MKIKFEELEEAFDYVSFGVVGEHSATLNLVTGEIRTHSDFDLEDENPDEEENEDMIEIPHKNELGLGKNLVMVFVQETIPDEYDRIQEIFSSRGAYRRYKDFLESKELLDSWFEYESVETKKALREWCKDNSIELTS